MTSKYQELGAKIGQLCAEKQAAYGDSYTRSGDVLKILYPNGVQPDQYVELLAIARVLDKLFRIVTDPNYGDESPWKDIAGYALLGAARREDVPPPSPNHPGIPDSCSPGWPV